MKTKVIPTSKAVNKEHNESRNKKTEKVCQEYMEVIKEYPLNPENTKALLKQAESVITDNQYKELFKAIHKEMIEYELYYNFLQENLEIKENKKAI